MATNGKSKRSKVAGRSKVVMLPTIAIALITLLDYGQSRCYRIAAIDRFLIIV
jgi:hypothetical protein